MTDFVVIGGGIVGLAIAKRVTEVYPSRSTIVLEKEPEFCRHQSGRNSGVIHSGIFYTPGSLKAKLCRDGNASMVEFCRTHDIPHKVCGKLIVATNESELPRLKTLGERGVENGLSVEQLNLDQIRQYEPNAKGLAALRVPSTGIVDFKAVARRLASLVHSGGGEVRTNAQVTAIRRNGSKHIVISTAGEFETNFVISCAGLYSDRVAKMGGIEPKVQIIPFRGEYYELKSERRNLVNALIYPVPNPKLPFLGVHCTKMIDGSVHLGPNAVLAFAREGYSRNNVRLSELAETLIFPGFWRLIAKHLRTGAGEMLRSVSKSIFVRQLQRLVPAIREEDILPCKAGVRAQAVAPNGKMIDDFLVLKSDNAIHVCNAPSPAATASLEIARYVVEQIPSSTFA